MPSLPPLPLSRLARLAFWLAALTVLYFAVAPVSGRDPLTGWDKANHVLAFAVLASCGRVGWPGRARAVLVGLLLYGLSIEVVQIATPDHHFDLRDLAADALGILLGWCLTAGWRLASSPLRR